MRSPVSSKTPEGHSWRVIGPSKDLINLMSGGMVKFTLFDWECERCGNIIRSSREDRRIGPPSTTSPKCEDVVVEGIMGS